MIANMAQFNYHRLYPIIAFLSRLNIHGLHYVLLLDRAFWEVNPKGCETAQETLYKQFLPGAHFEG